MITYGTPNADGAQMPYTVKEAVHPLEAYGVKRRTGVNSLSLELAGPADAVAAVREGLPVAAVDRLQDGLGVSVQTISRVLNIKERTLARRGGEARLKSDESERVLRIGLLLDRSIEVLGGLVPARGWLQAPNTALGGASPLEYADTEPGAREVEAVLGRIEHGVFS